MTAHDLAALDDRAAELMAAERLLGYQPAELDASNFPAPPWAADLALGVLQAMERSGYTHEVFTDPGVGGGEMYFVSREAPGSVPPEEEIVRYGGDTASMATATCKAALIALNRRGALDGILATAR